MNTSSRLGNGPLSQGVPVVCRSSPTTFTSVTAGLGRASTAPWHRKSDPRPSETLVVALVRYRGARSDGGGERGKGGYGGEGRLTHCVYVDKEVLARRVIER